MKESTDGKIWIRQIGETGVYLPDSPGRESKNKGHDWAYEVMVGNVELGVYGVRKREETLVVGSKRFGVPHILFLDEPNVATFGLDHIKEANQFIMDRVREYALKCSAEFRVQLLEEIVKDNSVTITSPHTI